MSHCTNNSKPCLGFVKLTVHVLGLVLAVTCRSAPFLSLRPGVPTHGSATVSLAFPGQVDLQAACGVLLNQAMLPCGTGELVVL